MSLDWRPPHPVGAGCRTHARYHEVHVSIGPNPRVRHERPRFRGLPPLSAPTRLPFASGRVRSDVGCAQNLMIDIENVRQRFAISGAVILVGNQQWVASVTSITASDGRALVSIGLSGPHERRRAVRVRLDADRLEADGTVATVLERISAWLPHSDTGDILEL